jgi:hypothetical protein
MKYEKKDTGIIAQRITDICASREMSVCELERKLNLGNGLIWTWKKRSSPTASTVAYVADYLHVSLDYLFGRDQMFDMKAEEISAYTGLSCETIATLHTIHMNTQHDTSGWMKMVNDMVLNAVALSGVPVEKARYKKATQSDRHAEHQANMSDNKVQYIAQNK